ncbi:MAG: class I SAM-dependent methyltransferase [Caldilineaceae bacterium]
MPNDYEFSHYLAAKRTVDDRALNRNVWSGLAGSLAKYPRTPAQPPSVLEVACGIGTMVERVLEWGLFADSPAVHYTALDSLPANITAAAKRLHSPPQWFHLGFQTADVFEFCARPAEQAAYDLLIAHAFLDLLDIPQALPQLQRLLRPGGLFYFTINFDGATILEPTIDAELDARIESAYHHTMDARITDGRPSGDSRTGRHLFGHLAQAGFHVAAAGSSDWVVFPTAGRYPADEAYFLHFIVHTMHGALCNDPAVEGEAFEQWIATRHAQIERGELIYIAHQVDFVGHV